MSDASYNPGNALGILRPRTTLVEASYTRPANTTQYTAGDVVANSTSAATILTFANTARFRGGGGIIQAAVLIDSAVQSTKPDLFLHLFDTAPAMQNDNAAWAPSYSERTKEIGVIQFSGGNFMVSSNNGSINPGPIGVPFACAAGSSDLYGVLVVRNNYTPVSGEVLTIRLLVVPD